jgi:hypothetical protein
LSLEAASRIVTLGGDVAPFDPGRDDDLSRADRVPGAASPSGGVGDAEGVSPRRMTRPPAA